MRIYQSGWGIETAGWSIDFSDGVLTLCPADIEAALQLSAFRKKNGKVTRQELQAFSRERCPADIQPVGVTCGAFRGVYGEYVEEGAFWRNWWLAVDGLHLFVTFNCEPEHCQDHAAVVDWMLSTLETERCG